MSSSRCHVAVIMIAALALACGSADAQSISDGGGDASIKDARASDADSAALFDAADGSNTPDASDTSMCTSDAGADGGACSFTKCVVNADCCCSPKAGFLDCSKGVCFYEGPPN